MLGTAILPLALTVMIGPQILVAILLVLRKNPIKSSIVYILAVSLTMVLSTTIYYYILLSLDLFDRTKHNGSNFLKYLIVAFLLYSIVKNFLNRKKLTKPPKWMDDIKTIPLKKVFIIGVMLIALFPGDIAMAFTVAGLLIHQNETLFSAIPFFVLVTLIASSPLLVYLSMGKNAYKNMKKVNDWLNTHGWVINVTVNLLFIYIVLT